MAGGRPTKYRKEYCEMLIKHQKKGLSFQSFGATIGVDRATCDRWAHIHPEFCAAKKIAQEYCLLFWERLGIEGVQGKIQGFNAAVYCFNMKNRFQWRDKFELGVGDGRDFHSQLLDQIESAEQKVIDVEATERK